LPANDDDENITVTPFSYKTSFSLFCFFLHVFFLLSFITFLTFVTSGVINMYWRYHRHCNLEKVFP